MVRALSRPFSPVSAFYLFTNHDIFSGSGKWLGSDDNRGVDGGPLKVALKATDELPEISALLERKDGDLVGLKMARASIPHPAKDRGEDAWFTCNGDTICSLGVSDGVGEWAKDGIDAGKLARGLMKGAHVTAVNLEEAKVTNH